METVGIEPTLYPHQVYESCGERDYPRGMGPGQVFRLDGKLLTFVRTEIRPEDATPEHLFIGTENGIVTTRWMKDVLPEMELVNDTAGRAEASLAWAEVKGLEAEKQVLIDCLKTATSMLDDSTANELRSIYKKKMADVELSQR